MFIENNMSQLVFKILDLYASHANTKARASIISIMRHQGKI